MSHIISIRTQVRDPIAVASACGRLSLPAPGQVVQQPSVGPAVAVAALALRAKCS